MTVKINVVAEIHAAVAADGISHITPALARPEENSIVRITPCPAEQAYVPADIQSGIAAVLKRKKQAPHPKNAHATRAATAVKLCTACLHRFRRYPYLETETYVLQLPA